jgi:hypothetical protein
MFWLDQKYISLLGSQLERFKQTNRDHYNFRCPICNDSQKDSKKARGNIYPHKGELFFHCFNCEATRTIPNLIKEVNPELFKEYYKEKLMAAGKYKKSDVEIFADKMKKPVFIKMSVLNKLKKISSLKHDHPAKQYVVSRMIPTIWHHKLFYCPKFMQFTNELIPGKFPNVEFDEPRLIIPLIDKDKTLIGYQGRSFKTKTKIRYITIMLNDQKPKIFNYDQCDQTKPYFIFEGPIDAMFINNSLAMVGSGLDKNIINSDTAIFVYDNEPRSETTCDKIQRVIDKGYKIALFPQNIVQKDINDMIKVGYNSIDIEKKLIDSTCSGLKAQLKFNEWKKI